MEPGVLVIGVGSEHREDDAIGLLAVRDLQTVGCPWARFYESRGDGARLLSLWEGVDAVLLVDAIRSSSPTGTIHIIDVSEHPLPAGFRCTSSHQFGVNEAVETARVLGRLPHECVLIGVELGETRVGVPTVLYEDVKEVLQRSLRGELSRWNPEVQHDSV